MADISALQTAVSTLEADVATLLAKPTVPTQADIDAITTSVNATDANVKAAIALP